jgi:hypothetical protein
MVVALQILLLQKVGAIEGVESLQALFCARGTTLWGLLVSALCPKCKEMQTDVEKSHVGFGIRRSRRFQGHTTGESQQCWLSPAGCQGLLIFDTRRC